MKFHLDCFYYFIFAKQEEIFVAVCLEKAADRHAKQTGTIPAKSRKAGLNIPAPTMATAKIGRDGPGVPAHTTLSCYGWACGEEGGVSLKSSGTKISVSHSDFNAEVWRKRFCS